MKVGVLLAGGTVAAEVMKGSSLIVQRKGGPRDAGLVPSLVQQGLPDDAELYIANPLGDGKFSENMTAGDWLLIDNAARKLYEKYGITRIVVPHGTDTMTATATAEAFLLADLPIVMVVSGSNKPASQKGSDAPTNLMHAGVATLALAQLQLPNSYISFAGVSGAISEVHLGPNARKKVAWGNGFESVNRGRVGWVGPSGFHPLALPDPRESNLPRRDRLDTGVYRIPLDVNLDLDGQADYVLQKGYRGVVVELYPSATGPNGGGVYSLTKFVQKVSSKGIVVVGTVANPAPIEPEETYETTDSAIGAGMIPITSLLPGPARIKLMWALGNFDSPEEVSHVMTTNIVGELSRYSIQEMAHTLEIPPIAG